MRNKQAIRDALATVDVTQAAVVEHFVHMKALLVLALDTDDANFTDGHLAESQRQLEFPRVDHGRFSINWQGKTCCLGNTLPFHLFARIARSPNRYVTHVDLLEDVWRGRREPTTIRGVVKRLRDRLIEDGMQDLAKAIDGSVKGHYRFTLV